MSQDAKTRLAIEILNLLGKHAVEEKRVKSELIRTGKFSRGEAEDFLKNAVTQGKVYQREMAIMFTIDVGEKTNFN